MEPLLSIIVPTYGVAEFLPDCLDSLLAQTLTDIEIIVVDDGSPDECGEIADAYARQDSRVRVSHTANQGLGPARNNGAAVARGRYLTFVDSDDLVPSRAFELMVSTLESTGSDFAAGNAWRYLPGKGNVPSWTHRQAFAEDRLKTTIREFPLLLRDRMAWNKVYRRTFWEHHDFKFPAMRYEDYPVGMAAHLLASSVDVLSYKMYLWRQRAGGGSITQQTASVGNVRDRVISAEMVLDLVEKDGHEELIDGVHAYLTDIDLISVAESYAQAPAGDEAEMAELLTRLARRLKPQKVGTTRLAKLIHKSSLAGQLDVVRSMARWRQGGDRNELIKSVAKSGNIAMLPALVAAVTPRRRTLSPRNRLLRLSLAGSRMEGGTLLLDVTAKLRADVLRRAKLSAHLEVDGQSVSELPVRIGSLAGFGSTLVIELDPLQFGGDIVEEPGFVRVTATVGPLRWRGGIELPIDQFPAPVRYPDGSWLVVARHRGGAGLWVRRMRDVEVGSVAVSETGLTVTLEDSAQGFVALLRTAPSEPILAPIVDGVATFEWDEVIANDPADNPANGTSYRQIVHTLSLSRQVASKGAQEAWEDEDQDVELTHAEQILAEEASEIEDEAPDQLMGDETPEDDDTNHSVRPIYASMAVPPVRAAGREFSLAHTGMGAIELVMQDLDYVE